MLEYIDDLRENLAPYESRKDMGAYFPLRYVTDMFEYFKAHSDKYNIITYADLKIKNPQDYQNNYIEEFKEWCVDIKSDKDRLKKAHVLIQYDIDSHPERTNALLAHPHHDDVPATIMLFRDRVDRRHLKKTGELRFTEYNFDMDIMLQRMKERFVLGYHTNAHEKSVFDMEKAVEIFNDDMTYFYENFGVIHFSAHGGVPGPTGLNNKELPYDERWIEKSVWVHNGYTLRFHGYFSDGGHNNKTRDPAMRDLRDFIMKMEPGKRYRMLLHPQYYGAKSRRSPRYSGTKWYDDMMDLHESDSEASLWANNVPHEAFSLLEDDT